MKSIRLLMMIILPLWMSSSYAALCTWVYVQCRPCGQYSGGNAENTTGGCRDCGAWCTGWDGTQPVASVGSNAKVSGGVLYLSPNERHSTRPLDVNSATLSEIGNVNPAVALALFGLSTAGKPSYVNIKSGRVHWGGIPSKASVQAALNGSDSNAIRASLEQFESSNDWTETSWRQLSGNETHAVRFQTFHINGDQSQGSKPMFPDVDVLFDAEQPLKVVGWKIAQD